MVCHFINKPETIQITPVFRPPYLLSPFSYCVAPIRMRYTVGGGWREGELREKGPKGLGRRGCGLSVRLESEENEKNERSGKEIR